MVENNPEKDEEKKESVLEVCPICGEETLAVVSRCAICINCGFSLCSM